MCVAFDVGSSVEFFFVLQSSAKYLSAWASSSCADECDADTVKAVDPIDVRGDGNVVAFQHVEVIVRESRSEAFRFWFMFLWVLVLFPL